MNVFARRAFERPDVKADGARCNPRQHSSCLVGGADWSPDRHDAIASISGGSVTELSITGRYARGAVMGIRNPSRSRRWSILLPFRKLINSERARDGASLSKDLGDAGLN